MTKEQEKALERYKREYNVDPKTLEIRKSGKDVIIRHQTIEFGMLYEGFDPQGNRPLNLLLVATEWGNE